MLFGERELFVNEKGKTALDLDSQHFCPDHEGVPLGLLRLEPNGLAGGQRGTVVAGSESAGARVH